jgi:hypothetical protein
MMQSFEVKMESRDNTTILCVDLEDVEMCMTMQIRAKKERFDVTPIVNAYRTFMLSFLRAVATSASTIKQLIAECREKGICKPLEPIIE